MKLLLVITDIYLPLVVAGSEEKSAWSQKIIFSGLIFSKKFIAYTGQKHRGVKKKRLKFSDLCILGFYRCMIADMTSYYNYEMLGVHAHNLV